ncbi:MAG: transketolase [Bacillota bacterium]|nr:transketolase [Bacillota bacterium]MDK2960729.1 transketolase [Bacillota bacterium]
MCSPERIKYLQHMSRRIRAEVLKMIHAAKSGHPGGSLSVADIITVLYFHEMRLDPNNPDWPERDRFILSKGHACPAWYACLAELGYFPKEELRTLRQINSILQGHPDKKKTPGVDMTTGSLGQGLSLAFGMAMASRIFGPDYRVYVILGDGEVQEGQVWEAAMACAKYRLDNLVAIVDRNSMQVDGRTEDVMPIEPLVEKWRAFGWAVRELDGHNIEEIVDALSWARTVKERPTVLVAHTIKGKGVSFMENVREWHAKAPNDEQLAAALRELGEC